MVSGITGFPCAAEQGNRRGQCLRP
jgi:hypothetical protein